ncbi:hypothetical protein [uncultured Tolumonas sp.]|jgi:hypothetical protein|uniref:hypothetical protein n=1 Tax=uncultured Tolumonas sp. TaxID=263765 RepID=UPI002A0A147F|nr:hypothetical protein [uncultured Tolumonas sp.]
MTVSLNSYLKGFYDQTKALGKKVVNSDFTFEIEGFEGNYLLSKQCPWPDVSVGGEIEVPNPLGVSSFEPQQIKIAKQGQVSFLETTAGNIDQMLINIITNGGTFNAKIYEGTPQKYLRYKRIVDCFVQIDDPDRDWENRSQILTFSGTMFYHYFGETTEGNSTDYR